MYITAVDASKALDRLNHKILFDKLLARDIPHCFAAILRDWYSKLTSVVRWNGVLSSSFAVTCGVRQCGILSPILFHVYVDELIELLRDSGYGCYVNRTFIGCLIYGDDLLLLSPTVGGMQALLDICDSYGHSTCSNIILNTKKTTCTVLGNARYNDVLLCLNNQIVPTVDSFKYLGVKFVAKNSLYVDVPSIKRKFYAACNDVLNKSRTACETVQVQLISLFCLPLLMYCVGALELCNCLLRDLGVCWNDAFRSVFHLNRWESVKLIQYFCDKMDIFHYYDLQRWKFLSSINKIPFLHKFLSALAIQFHTGLLLSTKYCDFKCQSFSASVVSHFETLVM